MQRSLDKEEEEKKKKKEEEEEVTSWSSEVSASLPALECGILSEYSEGSDSTQVGHS